jgi:hypothetical protein
MRKKHKGKINHERYRDISIKYCRDNCPKTGESLKIILFKQDEKLRGHAVKHFINDNEAIRIWKESFPYRKIIDKIDECSKELKILGCPGSPCSKKHCNLYDECEDIVKNFVDEYVEMTYKIIKEGCEIPRYACCLEDRGESLWIMPNKKLVVKAYFHPDNGFYNTATCYPIKKRSSWQEARDYVRRRILGESLNKPVLCSESTWGSGLSLKEVFQKAFIEQKKKET